MDRISCGVFILLLGTLVAACKSGGADREGESSPRLRIVRDERPRQAQSGIPIDKQQDILLVLQQRDPTTLKCYSDELNRRGDRSFAGQVKVLIHFTTDGRASRVQIVSTTLNSAEVENCLIEKIQGFEFPELAQPGQMDYTFSFRPAY